MVLGDEDCEPSWQDRALCAQTDPEVFFPEKGGSTRKAKRVCAGCEARVECLEYAINNEERFGIWGGLSERERRRLNKGGVDLSSSASLEDHPDEIDDEGLPDDKSELYTLRGEQALYDEDEILNKVTAIMNWNLSKGVDIQTRFIILSQIIDKVELDLIVEMLDESLGVSIEFVVQMASDYMNMDNIRRQSLIKLFREYTLLGIAS